MAFAPELRSYAQKVCTLYKKAMRTIESYYVARYVVRYHQVLLRARFDENKNVSDAKDQRRLLWTGQEELFRKSNPLPCCKYGLLPTHTGYFRFETLKERTEIHTYCGIWKEKLKTALVGKFLSDDYALEDAVCVNSTHWTVEMVKDAGNRWIPAAQDGHCGIHPRSKYPYWHIPTIPTSLGIAAGVAHGRVVLPPDWVLDYWHPLEKAQYPIYFKKREERKCEYIEKWNRGEIV